jgi:hypothetical protein
MAGENLTTLSNVLTRRYDKRMEVFAYEDDPFLSEVKVDTNFGANDMRISLRYGDPQGGSIDYQLARTNRSGTSNAGFVLTRAHDYHTCELDAETLAAGKGAENIIKDAMDGQMEGAMRMIKRSLEVGVWGSGSGKRGTINATVTGTTMTLAVPSDIVNFEVGGKYYFRDPAGGLRDSGEEVTVTAIADDGAMTVTPNLNTISGLAENDEIIREGDYNAHIKGLAAWLPLTAPSATTFFGQDRSLHTERLGGVRYTGSGAPKIETLSRALVRLARNNPGGKRTAYVNYEDFGDMIISLGAKAIVEPMKSSKGEFGFESLKLYTPRGALPVMGSINCPKGEFYILQNDTWVLKSLGKLPHYADEDGLKVRRDDTTSDSVFWTLRYWAQLGCYAPGWNLHGTF